MKEKKSDINICINAEKVFDESQHIFMIKIEREL